MKAHWIKTNLESATMGKKGNTYNIYSPNHYRDKEICWKTLKETTMEDKEENIILGGDLNIILKPEEKRGGLFQPDPYREALQEIIK